jgi:hypothetical protein
MDNEGGGEEACKLLFLKKMLRAHKILSLLRENK